MSKLARRSNGCAGGIVGVERSVREREVGREKPLVELRGLCTKRIDLAGKIVNLKKVFF